MLKSKVIKTIPSVPFPCAFDLFIIQWLCCCTFFFFGGGRGGGGGGGVVLIKVLFFFEALLRNNLQQTSQVFIGLYDLDQFSEPQLRVKQ